jgi:hypothetical protein
MVSGILWISTMPPRITADTTMEKEVKIRLGLNQYEQQPKDA